jgi:hypothetical protein
MPGVRYRDCREQPVLFELRRRYDDLGVIDTKR